MQRMMGPGGQGDQGGPGMDMMNPNGLNNFRQDGPGMGGPGGQMQPGPGGPMQGGQMMMGPGPNMGQMGPNDGMGLLGQGPGGMRNQSGPLMQGSG